MPKKKKRPKYKIIVYRDAEGKKRVYMARARDSRKWLTDLLEAKEILIEAPLAYAEEHFGAMLDALHRFDMETEGDGFTALLEETVLLVADALEEKLRRQVFAAGGPYLPRM